MYNLICFWSWSEIDLHFNFEIQVLTILFLQCFLNFIFFVHQYILSQDFVLHHNFKLNVHFWEQHSSKYDKAYLKLTLEYSFQENLKNILKIRGYVHLFQG